MTRAEYERRERALLGDRDAALRALHAQGLTYPEIVEKTGWSWRTVASACGPGRAKRRRKSLALSD